MPSSYWACRTVLEKNLGLSILWADGRLPRVASYFQKICALPAMSEAVIDWPDAHLKRRPDLDASLIETLSASAQ